MEKYLNALQPEADPLGLEICSRLAKDGLSHMHVSSYEAHLLQWLIKVFKVKTCLEIGMLYGYSTLKIAEVLPPHGKITSLEKNPIHYDIAKNLLGSSPFFLKCDLILADAEEWIANSPSDLHFDMIFIDANKGAYGKYLSWAKEHISLSGIIVADNTFLFGHVFGESERTDRASDHQIKTMQEFNQNLMQDSSFNAVVLPTVEGMTVAQRVR